MQDSDPANLVEWDVHSTSALISHFMSVTRQPSERGQPAQRYSYVV